MAKHPTKPYLDLTPEELAFQYSPRVAVPDHPVWKAHWNLASELVRHQRKGRLRVPYGPTPGQTLDIFPAANPGSPINIFIHGGFWRFLDSFDHTLVAPAVLEAGGASILLNYDLCPKVPLTEVVRQVRAALKWVWENADQANGDRDRIFISGHSAGGHLTMMLGTDDFQDDLGLPGDAVKGLTVVSAMLDLEPVMLVPGSEDLRIDAEEARLLSPRFTPPRAELPIVLAVGGRETREWIRQTDDMRDVLEQRGNPLTYLKPDYDQHYSILFSLGNPLTELCASMLLQMGLEPLR
ncbi:MAG: alpha/beta hydrolase [Rhizobiaceae bacterium]